MQRRMGGIDGYGALRPPRVVVIVVEQSSETRSAIGARLREDGHEVVEVSDGVHLLAWLLSLVALDRRRRESIAVVANPVGSVPEVLEMLRSARWATPVVLITEAEDAPSLPDLGAVATFRRPLDLDALRAVVGRAVPPRQTPPGS